MVTALDAKGRPDYEANGRIIDYLIRGGVDGILILGSMGEFTEFTTEERSDYLTFCVHHTAGRVELYAGTGSMRFEDTISITNKACSLGYSASLVIGPYYYGIDQDELFTYYNRIAHLVDGQLYVYNFPARTGHCIAPETFRSLCEKNENICGIKDSVLEPGHTRDIAFIASTLDRKIDVHSGFDDQFVNNQSFQGSGGIGGLSNVVPEIWHDLVACANAGDYEGMLKCQ